MTKSYYHFDTLPSNLMDVIESNLTKVYDPSLDSSLVPGNTLNEDKRRSRTSWVPTQHWVGGLMWDYCRRVNDEFFHYDLEHIDGESVQYTHYGINERYTWHQDESLAAIYKPVINLTEKKSSEHHQNYLNNKANIIRKLSATLQLSHSDDYEGGATQIRDWDNKIYTIPRERGSLVFFDSRLYHRACKVTSGLRKSLVIWAIGPRWK